MTITDVHIYSYALPFRRPVTMLRQKLPERRGVILSLQNENGDVGLGDVAPFPGLSTETLARAKEQVRALAPQLAKRNIHQLDDIENFIKTPLLSSVRFGVESALLDLWATAGRLPISALFNPKPLTHIKINALLTDDANAAAEAEKLSVDGYCAIKTKVGRRDIDEEIQMVREVRRILGNAVALRLDANCAWALDEAVRFADGVRDCTIDYIEEPLQGGRHLEQFYDQTALPTALDESLTPETAAAPPRGVAAFIIKPGIDGGVFAVIKLIRQAQKLNIAAILSSPFLSAIGLNMTLQLASAFIDAEAVMGLGTFHFFEKDFLNRPVRIENGAIDVADFSSAVALNNLAVREEANDESR